MSAQPKKKISKVRSKTRRAHWHGALPKLMTCAKCKASKLPHRACPECGYYGRAKVISTKLESRVAKTLEKTKSIKKTSTKPAVKKSKPKKSAPKTDQSPES